ncbi:Two-component response regulator [Trema orientale]|uniref:Two-component response regulator n=1 Tax=Trema orientale TaxID=63057 RepID=A0A2P5FYS9_TREOI|nr:Two-component response regulator [Trema orientale]
MVLGNEFASDLKGKEVVTSDELETTDQIGKTTTTFADGGMSNNSPSTDDHHVEEAEKSSSNSTTIATDDVQVKNMSSTSTGPSDDGQKKLSVLIVDDASFIRLMHSSIVRTLGLEPQVAENGQEAVDLHRSGASFDLILMDKEMPVMGGIKATRELRAMGVDTMIVGVTASEGAEIQTFLEAGLNECFTKPLYKDKLAPIVQLIMEAKHHVQA